MRAGIPVSRNSDGPSLYTHSDPANYSSGCRQCAWRQPNGTARGFWHRLYLLRCGFLAVGLRAEAAPEPLPAVRAFPLTLTLSRQGRGEKRSNRQHRLHNEPGTKAPLFLSATLNPNTILQPMRS